MFAASGGSPAILVGDNIAALTYGFINESYLKIVAYSPLTKEFYWDNPYVEVGGRTIGGQLNWACDTDINSRHGQRIVEEFRVF